MVLLVGTGIRATVDHHLIDAISSRGSEGRDIAVAPRPFATLVAPLNVARVEVGRSNSNHLRGGDIGLAPGEEGEEEEEEVVEAVTAESELELELVGDTMRRLFKLGSGDPKALLEVLLKEDPLRVGGIVGPDEFTCPPALMPDVRNHDAERRFKERDRSNPLSANRGGFLWYQHLRKAGGTGFCDLVRRNMEVREVPNYYCMTDNAGRLGDWDNGRLVDTLASKGQRVTANEWNAFPLDKLELAESHGAVFATTFRHPVDRIMSQYRFEHLERRDNHKGDHTPIKLWAKRREFMRNYYIKTFAGTLVYDSYPKHPSNLQELSWELFSTAMDTVSRFNLVLCLDWLDLSEGAIESTLGFDNPLPKRVRPHIGQAPREESMVTDAEREMGREAYEELCERNALDLLFTHWMRRLVLERMACTPSSR